METVSIILSSGGMAVAFTLVAFAWRSGYKAQRWNHTADVTERLNRDFAKWQERLVRMETKVDFIAERLGWKDKR